MGAGARLSVPPRKKIKISKTKAMPLNPVNHELLSASINGNGSLESIATSDGLESDSFQSEIVRLMVQELQHMGFGHSAATLEKEAGICLEAESIATFKTNILEGQWEQAAENLADLELAQGASVDFIKFLIYRQKFLELLEQGQVQEGLRCLRQEITPLKQDSSELHLLSSYMMAGSVEALKKKAHWDGVAGNSRAKLLGDIRAHISAKRMIPERRLETLLQQALAAQRERCLYHNVENSDDDRSLLEDHKCGSSRIPTITTSIFEEHTDEVWYVKFSNDGTMLASASKDTTVIIWDVVSMTCKQALRGHEEEVSFVSWSPSDDMLLSWRVRCYPEAVGRKSGRLFTNNQQA